MHMLLLVWGPPLENYCVRPTPTLKLPAHLAFPGTSYLFNRALIVSSFSFHSYRVSHEECKLTFIIMLPIPSGSGPDILILVPFFPCFWIQVSPLLKKAAKSIISKPAHAMAPFQLPIWHLSIDISLFLRKATANFIVINDSPSPFISKQLLKSHQLYPSIISHGRFRNPDSDFGSFLKWSPWDYLHRTPRFIIQTTLNTLISRSKILNFHLFSANAQPN